MWTGPPVPVSWRSLPGGGGGFAVKEMIFFYPSPLPSLARPPLAPLLPEEVRRDGRFGDLEFLHIFLHNFGPTRQPKGGRQRLGA